MSDGPRYLEALTIVEPRRDGDKARWVRIGTGFYNQDGSINIIFDALPVNGKVQLRTPKPRDERGGRSGHDY